jgi:hypothetical protein
MAPSLAYRGGHPALNDGPEHPWEQGKVIHGAAITVAQRTF